VLPVISLGFAGCVLDEASEPQKKSLSIVADRLSHEDSTTIEQFAKKYQVSVSMEVLSPETILKRVLTDRYNANIDILLTEDQSLRKELHALNALRPIRNTAAFGLLERQFNNQHHYWLPVSHDPLIVTRHKDSTGCSSVDFRSWHKNDSLRPAFNVLHHREQYLSLIKASSGLRRLQAPNRMLSTENVYALSEFVERSNNLDSLYRAQSKTCRYFLIENQRYVSLVNTLSIFRYGRNTAVAERFLNYFAGNAYAVSSGRNQLSTRKNSSPNWYIRSLSIQ